MQGRCCRCLLLFRLVLSSSITLAQVFAPSASQDGGLLRSRPALPPTFSAPAGPHVPVLPRPLPSSPADFGFANLARHSGTIFAGTVVSITRTPPAREQAAATVAVTFQVERALRGANAGELTIHEWAGLWTGAPRYRPGDHLLMFFYPPSKLGLTSPVGGELGRFAIDPAGDVALSPLHRQAFRSEIAPPGKSSVPLTQFIHAVRRAAGEE